MPEREEHGLDSLLADADGGMGRIVGRMSTAGVHLWKRHRRRRITAGIQKGSAAM